MMGFCLSPGCKPKPFLCRPISLMSPIRKAPGGWRELMPGAGMKSASITGEGLFTDSGSSALARSVFFTQSLRDYRFVLPEFGTLEGAFLLSELTYRGAEQGLAKYGMTLTSAGEPSFTPAI